MRRLLAALLPALVCGLAAAAPSSPAGTMTVESKAARFRCSAPRWERSEDPAQDEREKVFGVTLREPGAGAAAATISIEWYAPGNSLFDTADDFVAVNASTETVVAGASAGPVRRLKVAGLPARRWSSTTFRPSAPNAVAAARVEVRSEDVVVEFSGGFYALSFTAPADAFAAKRAAFQRVLDTFAPLRR